MELMELAVDIGSENAIWGYQNLRDLIPQRQREKSFVIPKNTIIATISSGEYEEQEAYSIEVPFEIIDFTLPNHKKILGFLNSDIYKVRPDFREIVTPRILELINDVEEEADEEQGSIDFDSFKGFIYFLAKNKNVTIPSFIITSRGNVRALWRRSRKQHLAVEFYHDEIVTYVVFATNSTKPEKTMRSSGTISQNLLCGVAVSLGADKWIFK